MQGCNNAAGRVSIKAGNNKYNLRGDVTVQPSTVEREADANANGTHYVTVKAVPAEAEITISDRMGQSLAELGDLSCVDVTITLIDMKRQYLFTEADLVGRASLNTGSGEISGLKVVSSACREVNL